MNRQIILSLLLAIGIVPLLDSCRCGCDCERNLGCKILKVKDRFTDSLLLTKTFCSQTNYYTDKTLKDSVDNFTAQHQTDSTIVTWKDSIYKYEKIENLKCKDDLNGYENAGYGCTCYK